MNIQALNRQNPADVGARPAYEANPPMPPEANPCILPAILDKFGHLAARLSAGTEILKENGERAGRSRRRKYTVEDLVQRLGEAKLSTTEFRVAATKRCGMSRAMFYRLLKEGRKELRFRQRGDTHKERLAKLKAEREQVELENAITKGDFLNRQALEQAFVEIVAAMKQIVRASKLDRASQDDFLRTLSSIPIVIRDTARAAHQRNGPNGDGATLRKPRKKKKAAANKVTDG